MTTRRSARLTAKAAAEQIIESQPAQTEKPAQSSRASKKQKLSNEKVVEKTKAAGNLQNRKRKRGDSVFMKELPLDVILEIFGQLEPIDLLHLSRVSKSLHDLLTSSNVTFLWKLAYKNLKLGQPPPCPAGTNLIFYSNFLYGRHCLICCSGNARSHHETAFIRLCGKCADTSLLLSYDVNPIIASLCYQWDFTQKGRAPKIVKAEYKLRVKEFTDAKKKKKEGIYVNERRNLCLLRNNLGHEIYRWRGRLQRHHALELKTRRLQREDDIKMRLEVEGFLADFNRVARHAHRIPHVRKGHELTDSEWSFIRADILDFFQGIREDRLTSIMRDELSTRIRHLQIFLSSWRIVPTCWWIVSSDERIALFIKNENPKKKEDFQKLESQLQKTIASWREETDRYLTSLIPQPSGKGKKKASNTANPLELATTFFKCHWCTEPISYPRVLMHTCFTKDPQVADEDDDNAEEVAVVDRRRIVRQPRPPKLITHNAVLPVLLNQHNLGMHAGMDGVAYDGEAFKAVREIVILCGKDPNTVTYAEMEEADARIECLRCSRAKLGRHKRLIMKWTMALVHELDEHYDEPTSSEAAWRMIERPAELEKIREAERKMKKLKKHHHAGLCKYCSFIIDPDQQLRHIRNHMITVDENTLSSHFNPPVDASISELSPVVKM